MKQVFPEEWHLRSKNIRISQKDMNKLVINFLIVEGYKESAINFAKETRTEITEEDLKYLEQKNESKQLILKGEIDKAIERINKDDPEVLYFILKIEIFFQILEKNVIILFNLKLQKMIEMIKQDKIDQAIQFAEAEIISLVEQDVKIANITFHQNKLLEQLERVMALLAFENTKECPVKDLVENEQKIKISSEINYHLRKASKKPSESKITTLIKLLNWSQNILKQHCEYPELLDISKGQFSKYENEVMPNLEIE